MGAPSLPDPWRARFGPPFPHSHSLAVRSPCTALPQNNCFGNASALLQVRMKMFFFWRTFSSFSKNAHSLPRTGVHKQQERRPYPCAASSPHCLKQPWQHPANFKQMKNSKNINIFKLVPIKTKKPFMLQIMSKSRFAVASRQRGLLLTPSQLSTDVQRPLPQFSSAFNHHFLPTCHKSRQNSLLSMRD